MKLCADDIYKIKSRLFAYSPNLKQSWILYVIVMLSYYIALTLTVQMMYFVSIIYKDIVKITPEYRVLVNDLLAFAAVAIVVVILGKNNRCVPVTPPRQSPLLWLLLVPFILSVGFATELFRIPEYNVYAMLWGFRYRNNFQMFLSSVIVMPVFYEWMCRGIILKGLLARYSPLKAILWSSVIFGIMHINPREAVLAFCIGIAIGWIYWRTRSLWLCIFMHMVFSAVSFMVVRIFYPDVIDLADPHVKITYYQSIADITGTHYIYVVALFVCALTGIWIKKIVVSPVVASDIQNRQNPMFF